MGKIGANMNSVLDNFIINKKEELAKLKKEYQMILESNTEISNSGSEVSLLNSELCKLMAEINILKTNKPEISVHYYYDTANVKNSNPDSATKAIYVLNELINIFNNMGGLDSMILEDLRSRNESLKCLHRKLVRRLRRLSRCFSTTQSEKISKSIRNESGEILTNSFYRVLKNLIVELQDRTFTSNDWDQLQSVLIDQTYNKEHIKLLQEPGSIGDREVYRRMKTVYREHSLSTTRVQEWRKRFSEGMESLKDNLQPFSKSSCRHRRFGE
ncbi:uncharacterized protein CDAR_57981 [Caerostris darwini]|uniref:Uncharacterized protein n=1 Tax=Caerostris darwini TaxID=1538125 RepID=A0AAV4U6Y7_9ARAC|nr:uncharacterized protein CDAR_57981 [Caerostris darwini]